MRALAHAPALVALVERQLGPNPVLYCSQVCVKRPADRATGARAEAAQSAPARTPSGSLNSTLLSSSPLAAAATTAARRRRLVAARGVLGVG